MAVRAALPVELHLDAVIAVGVDHGAGWPNHDRALLALHGRTRMQQLAVRIAAREVTVKGRYATYEDKRPAGIYASAYPNEVYESVRYRWTIEQADAAGAAFASPRTGVNNCTPPAADGGPQWNGEAFNVKEIRPENVEAFREHSPRYQGGHLNHLKRRYE